MKYPIFFWMLLLTVPAFASDLSLSEPILYTDRDASYAVLNVQWNNAWHNDRNHDAAWVFFKFLRGNEGYQHALLEPAGHTVVQTHNGEAPGFSLEVPEDRTGLFIVPPGNFRGEVHLTVKVLLDRQSFERVNTRRASFTAYGLEMVQVPEGGFFVGDRDTAALRFGSLYQSSGDGAYGGLFEIKSENQTISISPDKGDLFYLAPEGYEGDRTGSLPSTFPKGVAAFYILKYEPTQGQYAAFLNSLSATQSQHRANFGGKDYQKERGSIHVENDLYVATHPQAPCNFMSWDDAMAYADWACLSPLTELEFTKAARGPKRPESGEDFPWGTSSKLEMQRMVSANGELEMLNGKDESHLSDATRKEFGASYYWVMDLSGSLWERVITLGDEKGRQFQGSSGDGQLSNYGFATNEDWPRGIAETGGFGFRGGGFYGYGRDYHDFNPFSPVSHRPYGAWSGGNREKAYGARFVKR